jgi:hypothetical protein
MERVQAKGKNQTAKETRNENCGFFFIENPGS